MGKKQITILVVGLILFGLLIIGAAYAYFFIGTSTVFETASISANTYTMGTVTLNTINSSLTLSLSNNDMRASNSDVLYYATPSGKSTNSNDKLIELARATVSTVSDINYYRCDYTLSITKSGTNNMYDLFQNNYSNKSTNQIKFYLNDATYDWAGRGGMPTSYSDYMIVTSNAPASIYAGLSILNSSTIDQLELSGSDINISIVVSSFTCKAIASPTYAYSNYTNSTPSSSPGNMLYYKRTTSFNSETTEEVCGIFNSTEICVDRSSWNNRSSLYSTFTTAGATCNSTYESDVYLECSYGNVYCRVSNGNIKARCGIQSENCYQNSWNIVCESS